MEPNIKKVVSYKTDDDVIFEKKKDAIDHASFLIEKEKLVELVQQVAKLFEADLNSYKAEGEYDENEEYYRVELEEDFWEDSSEILTNATSNDVFINGFEDYVKLIIKLINKYHLEGIIELIKKN